MDSRQTSKANVAGQGGGCGVAEGYKKEVTAQLIPSGVDRSPCLKGGEGEQGDVKVSPKKPAGDLGWGRLQKLGLCLRDCIMGDKFTAKLLSYEGYHRYISVTGGAWGKKVWRVRVGAEY